MVQITKDVIGKNLIATRPRLIAKHLFCISELQIHNLYLLLITKTGYLLSLNGLTMA